MSSLTALKLERELEITRRAMFRKTERPRLMMQWSIDPLTGRPIGTWVAEEVSVDPTEMPEAAFADLVG